MTTLKEIANILYCPISKKIFRHPVVASDGNTYEKEIIERLIDNDETDIFGLKIHDDTLLPNNNILQIVNIYLSNFPDMKGNQYVNLIHVNEEVKDDLTAILINKNFQELYRYKNFKLNMDHDIYIDNNNKYTLDSAKYKKTLPFMHLFFELCTDVNILKYVIDNSVNLNCEYKDDYMGDNRQGIRPIYYICKYCPPKIVFHFLNKNVDTNVEFNYSGITPTGIIAEYNNHFTPNDLISFIKKVDSFTNIDKKRNHVFHFVCSERNADFIINFMDLIHKEFNPKVIDEYMCAHSSSGDTPVDHLIKRFVRNTDIIDMILKYNFNFGTSFIRLIEYSTHSIIKHVIQNTKNLKEIINKPGYYCFTPLVVAIMKGYPDIVKLLVSKGANIAAPTDVNEHPIHYVCKYQPNLIDYFLSLDINPDKATIHGLRPLHTLLQHCHDFDTIKTFIDGVVSYYNSKNLDYIKYINAPDKYGTTPVHLSYLFVLQYFDEIGVDLNKVSRKGVKLIHEIAGSYNKSHKLPFLLGIEGSIKSKIDYKCTDILGYSPIHYAIASGSVDNFTTLIEFDPSLLDTLDKYGRNIRDIAILMKIHSKDYEWNTEILQSVISAYHKYKGYGDAKESDDHIMWIDYKLLKQQDPYLKLFHGLDTIRNYGSNEQLKTKPYVVTGTLREYLSQHDIF